MKALTDPVGLWVPCFGPDVLDVVEREVKLVVMTLGLSAVLSPSIG